MTKKDGSEWARQREYLTATDIRAINMCATGSPDVGHIRTFEISQHRSWGGGATIADVNGNGRADILFMAVDNPEGLDNFRYTIAWDVDYRGYSGQANPKFYPSPSFMSEFGFEHNGGDVVIYDINNDGILDVIFFAIRDWSGEDEWQYVTGYKLNTNGHIRKWRSPRRGEIESEFNL